MRRWSLATMHLISTMLLSVPIVHIVVILVTCSLRSIVHLDSSAIQLLAIHFLESSFRFFFRLKFYESVSFRFSAHWIDDNFSLTN